MSFLIQTAKPESQHGGEHIKTSQWAIIIGTLFETFCPTPAAVLEPMKYIISYKQTYSFGLMKGYIPSCGKCEQCYRADMNV